MAKERKNKISRGRKYNISDMQKAVEEVKNGKSMRSASCAYKVPYATLQSRVRGTYSLDVKPGPNSIMSNEEEKQLVDWIFNLSKCGFPITKEHLLDTVHRIVVKAKRSTPFTNGRPGRHWYESFLKRHPELSERMSQNLTNRRASVTEKALRSWYTQIKSYLTSKALMGIDPGRIFNLDESGFLLSPKTKKVLVQKGEKAVYSVCDNEKECYTALIAGNAAGQIPPIMVVYNYERIPSLVAKNFPNEFVIGKSETGWMTSETFYMYIANTFYQWCVKSGIVFPIILYVDGHSSHLTMELSDFCCAHQIELIALFPNATHIMQPMDVGFFHPLKTAYREAVRNWRLENNGEALTKIHFASVLKTAIDSLDTKKILQSSFKSCGLHPFSAESINYSKLIKNVDTLNTSEESTSNQIPYDVTRQEHLIFIESNIEPSILQEFEKSYDTNTWTGSIEYKELFNFWLKCKMNLAASPREPSIINQNKNPLIDSPKIPDGSISETDVEIELYTDFITDKVLQGNSSNELKNNTIIIDEGSVSDSEVINELQNIATISNNENFVKTTDDSILINQFTVDENNLIKSSKPIAISRKLLENNLITSPVILEDDLITESLINENSNTRIPSDETTIKDNTILSETYNNIDLLGNNNFEINLSLDKENKSSSSEKDLQFQTDTHFNNELPIDLSIVNKSSTNNSDSIGDYYKLEYEENNNNNIYPSTVQQDCKTCGDENIAPNVNASFTKLQAHSALNANSASTHSVFQDCLFMPKKKTQEKKKRQCKERLPFVATGAEWRAWHTQKLEEKEKKEIKKVALQKERTVIAKVKQESEENLKKLRSEKNKITLQFKELELRLKENKAKEKLFLIQSKKGTPEDKETSTEQIKNIKQKIQEDLQLKENLGQIKKNFIAEEKAIKGVRMNIKQPLTKNKQKDVN